MQKHDGFAGLLFHIGAVNVFTFPIIKDDVLVGRGKGAFGKRVLAAGHFHRSNDIFPTGLVDIVKRDGAGLIGSIDRVGIYRHGCLGGAAVLHGSVIHRPRISVHRKGNGSAQRDQKAVVLGQRQRSLQAVGAAAHTGFSGCQITPRVSLPDLPDILTFIDDRNTVRGRVVAGLGGLLPTCKQGWESLTVQRNAVDLFEDGAAAVQYIYGRAGIEQLAAVGHAAGPKGAVHIHRTGITKLDRAWAVDPEIQSALPVALLEGLVVRGVVVGPLLTVGRISPIMSRLVRIHPYRQIGRLGDRDIRHTYYGILADSRRYVYRGCNNTIDRNSGGHRRHRQQDQQHHQGQQNAENAVRLSFHGKHLLF